MIKIAVVGKGGVGKTTVAGTLARLLARDGYRVLAVDADPAMNLASILGHERVNLLPLYQNDKLVKERTYVGSSYGIFSLTPKVDDIVENFGVTGPDGVTLVVMGTVQSAGGGCMCPAYSLLTALLRHLLLERNDTVVMDMEAGLEHLGRGTIRGVDTIVDIIEPSAQAVETAIRIRELSRSLGVRNAIAVGNKIRNIEEERFLRMKLTNADMEMIHTIPYDAKIAKADRMSKAPIDFAPSSPTIKAIKKLEVHLIERFDRILL